MRPTQRTYTDIETNEEFILYSDDTTGRNALMNNNKTVKSGYICAHSGVEIKLNTKKVIKLDRGTFYNLKQDEQVTHKKYLGFKRFTKI